MSEPLPCERCKRVCESTRSGRRRRCQVCQRLICRRCQSLPRLHDELVMCGTFASDNPHDRLPDDCRSPLAAHETEGSKPGAYEFEVTAPDGFSFDGETHSVIARGATRSEARRLALEEARKAALRRCPYDCDCRAEDEPDRLSSRPTP